MWAPAGKMLSITVLIGPFFSFFCWEFQQPSKFLTACSIIQTRRRSGSCFSSFHAVKCTALFIYVLLNLSYESLLLFFFFFFLSVIPGFFVNCRTSSNCVNMHIQSSASPHLRLTSLDPSNFRALKVPTSPTRAASTNAAHLGYCSLQHVRRLRYLLCWTVVNTWIVFVCRWVLNTLWCMSVLHGIFAFPHQSV